jgi:hypothetical protein
MLSPVCTPQALHPHLMESALESSNLPYPNVRETRIRPPDIEINYADSWLPVRANMSRSSALPQLYFQIWGLA